MIGFFMRFLFLLFIVIFQVSFLNTVFSDSFLNALLATAIAWTLTRGFVVSWPWIVSLGLVFDMISMEVVGISALVLVIFSYGISFVSRRFLVEHKGSGMAIAGVFMAVASVAYFPSLWLVRNLTIGTPWSRDAFLAYFSTIDPVFGAISNAALLVIVYGIVVKMNRALDFYDDRVVVKR